ncbi:MAG: MAPEG family protein [Microcoleaceae cyanobacterium]
MEFPVISAGTASVLALLQIFLALLVGFFRIKYKVGIGDSGHEKLARQVRVHGNLIENAPIFIILLTFLELSGGSQTFLLSLAGVFIFARISHAIALSQTSNPFAPLRAIGAFGSTFASLLCAGSILRQIL